MPVYETRAELDASDPEPYQSACCCDTGNEDAEPCDEDDCVISFAFEIGTPH